MVQGSNDGRDHHPNAFTMWMAGGGIKPGITLGESDDLGFQAVKDRVHVHDLHATILHLLGFDHTRLTYRFQGRDFRLTDVFGNVSSRSCWRSRPRRRPAHAEPIFGQEPSAAGWLRTADPTVKSDTGSCDHTGKCCRDLGPEEGQRPRPSRPSRSCRPRC